MAPKKGSPNNNYYWFLLLPIAALVVVAILLIPRSKGHDWDDDEDDEDNPRTEARRGNGNSAVDRFTDDELRNFPTPPDPAWGGNSPAFRKEVAPGVIISARENAFEQPTNVRFRLATKAEDEWVAALAEQQLEQHIPLFSFDLDAGLAPGQHMPGTFNVEMDLEEMDVPEDIWDALCVSRVDEKGYIQEWNCRVKDGKLSRPQLPLGHHLLRRGGAVGKAGSNRRHSHRHRPGRRLPILSPLWLSPVCLRIQVAGLSHLQGSKLWDGEHRFPSGRDGAP